MRNALKAELLLLWMLCDGTWREGYFTGDHGGYVKQAPERAPLENLKVGSFTGDFERRAKDGSRNEASVL